MERLDLDTVDTIAAVPPNDNVPAVNTGLGVEAE